MKCPGCGAKPRPGSVLPNFRYLRCGRCRDRYDFRSWGGEKDWLSLSEGIGTVLVDESYDSHYTVHKIQPSAATADWSKTWKGTEAFPLGNLVKLACRFRTKNTPHYNLQAMKFYIGELENALAEEDAEAVSQVLPSVLPRLKPESTEQPDSDKGIKGA